MSADRVIVLKNTSEGIFADELRSRLAQGLTVTVIFGGSSMMPLIRGGEDRIRLEPSDGSFRVGGVYLFVYRGAFVVHRLLRVSRGELFFRGDNSARVEKVAPQAVMARLVAVERGDGSVVRCDSLRWRLRSLFVCSCRSFRNVCGRLFSRQRRRWQRWVYFFLLLLLMWAPMGVIGVPLNNFVFGIRLDHLLHASVYVPAVLFMMDFFPRGLRGLRRAWLSSLLLAVVTESVQYLLPYRGFDINDLLANFMGVTLGWLLLLFVMKRTARLKQ